ncbi:hypothetical protein BD289DRAFT_180810 [Coniella lustricola]|uniref:Secreted protein n=1 Tax=Coniella lustricola TaxID=2025994 RepID=A0A2T3ADC3_9PEZI|nr:hypothetical protein BD289DRAFT_180810 [Coniella lustricola]
MACLPMFPAVAALLVIECLQAAGLSSQLPGPRRTPAATSTPPRSCLPVLDLRATFPTRTVLSYRYMGRGCSHVLSTFLCATLTEHFLQHGNLMPFPVLPPYIATARCLLDWCW